MSVSKSEKFKLVEDISITAHHLKNPLSIIKVYLEALISEDVGKINPKQKEYLSDILENVKRMKETVNQLLDISLIEEKKYKIKLESVILENLVEEIINDFSIWARASNCKIFFEKPKNLPQVLTNPLKIRQVIENLISNALKYKLPGPGELEIKLKLKSKEILASFKDKGIGIPKEDFRKVFSKFYRSEQAFQIDSNAIGLGLYINKAIIELSGGKIWFKKNKDAGLTFYFTLPAAKNK